MSNQVVNEDLKNKIKDMKLSQIHKRLEEIHNKLKTNGDEAIDEIIPLLEETKLLKAKAEEMIGNIEDYLSSEGK